MIHGRSRIRLVVSSLALVGVLAAVAAGSGSARPAAANPYGLMDPTTLVVGMDLQFKPQMYLQNGKPAGYDVVLLNALAKQLGVKLKIENLDFNGLIPGLQSKKFDMVSVGRILSRVTMVFCRLFVVLGSCFVQFPERFHLNLRQRVTPANRRHRCDHTIRPMAR